MPTYRLISFIADDRPGLVEQLSEAINAHGGNWLESRMSQLAGKFTGIVRLSVPSARVDELEQALSGLGGVGLTLRFESPASRDQTLAGVRHQLEILGHDRPGIIQSISSQLAQHGVSIDTLTTHITSGAMSGEQMFQMKAQLTVPQALDVDTLQAALEGLANELMVDVSFDAAGGTRG